VRTFEASERLPPLAPLPIRTLVFSVDSRRPCEQEEGKGDPQITQISQIGFKKSVKSAQSADPLFDRAQQKSRTLIPGTAPLRRDLQLIAVPYFVVI
jgi:hypothetical protein